MKNKKTRELLHKASKDLKDIKNKVISCSCTGTLRFITNELNEKFCLHCNRQINNL